MKKAKKKFLKLPEYPGGREAFKKYIKSSLNYPAEAINMKIEGIVYLSAQVDDNWNVLDVEVDKGLGAGCDEEAVRLIKSVRFGGAKNRGFRIRSRKKFKIEFRLPRKQSVKYNLTKSKKNNTDNNPARSYSYTIRSK